MRLPTRGRGQGAREESGSEHAVGRAAGGRKDVRRALCGLVGEDEGQKSEGVAGGLCAVPVFAGGGDEAGAGG